MTNSFRQTQPGLSLSVRVSRWWKAQSAKRRRVLFMRGGLGAACFSAVVFGLPVLSELNSEQQAALQFRERNQVLAETQDAGAALRADAAASPLLAHDWLRSVEYSLERDPASALSRYGALERDRAALSGLHTLDIQAVSGAEDMVAQTKCLAEAVYYEARSERAAGQLAVAEVIANRVKDHRYPNSICGVVYQGATRTTGCQFTFTCDGALNRAPRGKRWDAAQSVAAQVMMGLNETKTNGATHYHATYVNPVWNSGLVRTRQIGTHIFYRFPRGGEWAAASAKQRQRLAQRNSGLAVVTPASSTLDEQLQVLKSSQPATPRDLNAAQLDSLTEGAEVPTPTLSPAPTEAPNVETASETEAEPEQRVVLLEETDIAPAAGETDDTSVL